MKIKLTKKQMRMLLEKGLLPKDRKLVMNGTTFEYIFKNPKPYIN